MRRPPVSGSLRPNRSRRGGWICQIDLGTVDGKRRRTNVYGATQRETLRLAAAARQERTAWEQERAAAPVAVLNTERAQQPLGVYLDGWLETMRPPRVESSTWTRYEQLCRNLPASFLRTPLTRLEPDALEAAYRQMLAAGLSASTVLKVHRMLHSALRQPVRWRWLAGNVTDLADPPRAARYQGHALSPSDARQFFAAVRGHRLEAVFVLALTTGMRQGELLALRWEDVDLTAGLVTVRASLRREGSVLKHKETKTHRIRVEPLIPLALEALERHVAVQASERLQAGDRWRELGQVFANRTGGPIIRDHLVKNDFRKLLVTAGLPRMRFHDLRHSCGTLLTGAGVDLKLVSSLLGHSGIAVTADVYSHPHIGMLRAAALSLERVLREP